MSYSILGESLSRCQIFSVWGYSRPVIPGFFTNVLLSQHFLERREVATTVKKEVAFIVSTPLVSCLWRCGESVNPPKLNIQEVQGGFVL